MHPCVSKQFIPYHVKTLFKTSVCIIPGQSHVRGQMPGKESNLSRSEIRPKKAPPDGAWKPHPTCVRQVEQTIIRQEWPANHVNSIDGCPMKLNPWTDEKQTTSNTTPLGLANVWRGLPRMFKRAFGRVSRWWQFRQTYHSSSSCKATSSSCVAVSFGA